MVGKTTCPEIEASAGILPGSQQKGRHLQRLSLEGAKMQVEQFSQTVAKIYAAAADFSLWGDALRAIEDLTGSAGAVVDFIPKKRAEPLTIAGRFTLEQCAEYAKHYQGECRRIGFAIANPHLPIHCDAMILSEAEMDRDPVYNWLATQGVRYYIGGLAGETEGYSVVCSVQRSRSQGHAEKDELRLFASLKSHIGQAVSLAEKLGTLRGTSELSLSLLNSRTEAVFALDGKGTVQFANRKGEQLLREQDGLTKSSTGLACRSTSQSAILNRLISSAASPGTSSGGGWMRIDRVSGRRPYAAFIAPLSIAAVPLGSLRAEVLMIIRDPEQRSSPDEEALTHLYGLTHAEARLACTLAAGHSLESAAASLGVKTATARAQVKAVFRKAEVNRQQDLLHILASACKPVQSS